MARHRDSMAARDEHSGQGVVANVPALAPTEVAPLRPWEDRARLSAVSVSRWPRFLVWGSDLARAILPSAMGARCRFGGLGDQRCG